MTVIYTVELTAEFDDTEKKVDVAEKSVLDPKRKAAWMHKIEDGLKPYVPDADIVCTNIQVFPTV